MTQESSRQCIAVPTGNAGELESGAYLPEEMEEGNLRMSVSRRAIPT